MSRVVQDVLVGGYVDGRKGAVLSVGYGDQQLIRHLTPGEARLVAQALQKVAEVPARPTAAGAG